MIQRTGTPFSSTIGEGSGGAALPSVVGRSQVHVNSRHRRGAVEGLPLLRVRFVKVIVPVRPDVAAVDESLTSRPTNVVWSGSTDSISYCRPRASFQRTK